VDKNIGRSPGGSGCQPTASAASASSRSGIPNAEEIGAMRERIGDRYFSMDGYDTLFNDLLDFFERLENG
jgi:hypothetical protein